MKNIFRKAFAVIVALLCMQGASSQGWEERYGGVMLQGFYWDSFDDTKWTNLTSQADELAAYFDLIWIPNSGSSGYNSMGYMPQYWFQHESSFGTSGELRQMINTYKEKGTGFIADVVINHRNGVNSWYDFPVETDHNGNTWELGLWAICANDEMAYADGQPTPTGANDEGENFDGCRDLDHTNSYVQDAVKAYLDYLLNDLGYVGFRYDMTKGYAAYYVGLYNAAVNPTYSVGEYYDGNYALVSGWIDGTIRDNHIQSGSFDFPLKFKMNEAFAYPSDFSKLAVDYNGSKQPDGLIKEAGFRRFSVTFVDNHDTYRDDGTKFNSYYTEAGNAFILCHPGTPCIFLPHWQSNKEAIKRLIDVRKSVGIHNQSTVEVWVAETGKYVAKVYGTNGDLFIKVGYEDYTPDGFNSDDIVASGEGYCVWSKVSISSSADKFVPDNDGNGISVYLEKNAVTDVWGKVYCYAWNDEGEYLTDYWPGTQMTNTVTVNGVEYYKYSFDSSDATLNLIFNNNEHQTANIEGVTTDTYYTLLSSDGSISEVNPDDYTGAEDKSISIYLKKSSVSSWSKVNYYAWDMSGNTLLGSWPGTDMKTTATESVCGEDFYVYTFPEEVTSLNIIFNNGSGKTADITGITETTYFSMNSDFSYSRGTDSITIFLDKVSASAWSRVKYYAWDSDENPLLGSWSGTEITQTICAGDGNEYYYYTFDPTITILNVIFNDGSNQTADITNITQSTFYKLDSTSGSNISVSTVDTYVATRGEAVEIENRECAVYPNPVTTHFVVRSRVDVACVSVYDLNGTLLQQVRGNVVDVRGLAPGLYIYGIELANGTLERGRFIKR